MDETKYNLEIQGTAQGIVQGKDNTVTNNFYQTTGLIDWNARLPLVKDLRLDSFPMGDISAATFPYVTTPIQGTHNDAVRALHDVGTGTIPIKHGILILGESNAGKTRFALETLKEALPTWPILCWTPEYKIEDAPPPDFLRGKDLVLLIDDLQNYIPISATKNINDQLLLANPHVSILRMLLRELIQTTKRVVVVVTCRSEHKSDIQAAFNWLFVQLENVVLPSFDPNPQDSESIAVIAEFQDRGVVHIEDWDGTLGS